VGREAWVDGKRHVWGIVRPGKDSLRMYNYWASTITERMALAPKQPYVGAKGQFEGLEDRWRKANRVNQAYLEYNAIDVNGNALPAPKREGPVQMEAALLQQMQVIEHDVQASLGIFKAGIGEAESQQSGRAILALQRESDTGTYHFGANLGISIRHAGRILVDLIPHYYDTKRIVRILGEDGEVQTATLDPELQVPYQQTQKGAIFNPTMGKYDVSITVGPSYNTKRMEAAAVFTELSKGAADPISAAVMRYLTVRHSDFTGNDEAAKMLRALIPAPIQEAASGQQQMPPQAVAQIQQLTQQLQVMQQELQQEQAGTKVAAMKVQGDHQAKLVQAQVDHDAKMKALTLQREVAAEQARLDREKAEAEFALKKWQAEKDAELAHAACVDKQNLAEREAQFEAGQTEKKFRVEQEQRQFDNGLKAKETQEKEAAQMMPKLEQVLSAMVESLKRMEQTQQEMLAEMKKPKLVGLDSIQRRDGIISGAKVTVQ
jgi:DNA-binding transcriptional regulator YdaS (Cro superfamily)